MPKSMNKVQLVGYLGQDPDGSISKSGKHMVRFSVATNDSWTDKQSGELRVQTDWHSIVAFGKLADIIYKSLKKGSRILLEGKLQNRRYTDNEGISRTTTEIIARDINILDKMAKAVKKDSDLSHDDDSYKYNCEAFPF